MFKPTGEYPQHLPDPRRALLQRKGRLQQIMRQRNLHYEPYASAKTLAKVISYADKGLLDYNKYDKETLRQFLRQRRLPYQTFAGVIAHRNTLCKADASRTFTRFLELPAEIRSEIYEYAMMDPWDAPRWCSRNLEPSLAAVSRKTRQEALPIFYRTTTFRIARGAWWLGRDRSVISLMHRFEFQLEACKMEMVLRVGTGFTLHMTEADDSGVRTKAAFAARLRDLCDRVGIGNLSHADLSWLAATTA